MVTSENVFKEHTLAHQSVYESLSKSMVKAKYDKWQFQRIRSKWSSEQMIQLSLAQIEPRNSILYQNMDSLTHMDIKALC